MTYRIRDPETWARAKTDYLAGLSAREVCERYDLNERSFHHHAKEGGWRRADQPDPEPRFDDDEEPLEPARTFAETAAELFARADQAVRRGRIAEADRCFKLGDRYRRAAHAEAAEARQADRAAADDSLLTLRALGEAARAGKAEADAVTAQLKAAMKLGPEATAQTLQSLQSLQSNPSIAEQVAALKARIAKRERLGAPANDLRKQLKRLEAPPEG